MQDHGLYVRGHAISLTTSATVLSLRWLTGLGTALNLITNIQMDLTTAVNFRWRRKCSLNCTFGRTATRCQALKFLNYIATAPKKCFNQPYYNEHFPLSLQWRKISQHWDVSQYIPFKVFTYDFLSLQLWYKIADLTAWQWLGSADFQSRYRPPLGLSLGCVGVSPGGIATPCRYSSPERQNNIGDLSRYHLLSVKVISSLTTNLKMHTVT